MRKATSAIGLMLLAAASGFWVFRNEDQSSSLKPKTESDSTPTVEFSAEMTTIPVSRDYQELQFVVDAQTMVDPDVASSAAAEDTIETFAGAVEGMDAAEVIRCLQSLLLDDLRGDQGRLLVRRWAAMDPAAACAWAAELGDSAARQELSTAAALAWSEQDPSGALDWAQTTTDVSTRSRLLTELGYELAREQPVEALNLVVELPQTPARDELILHSLRQWAVVDTTAARDWLLEWPESKLRHRALADFATVLAGRDGNEAARFVTEQIAPGLEQNRAAVGVAQRWAQQDRGQTLAWVAQFPAGSLRETAVKAAADCASN